ncbi:uncharacterized protein LOC129755741 isoform X3 [Uranotaenia lowii]|nr:uncharacterized protein LOC129755741 isoform X3 [Uranotaenia lowii]XP_055608344.1 uncharacterized protein LOC129755741 isoform X3 [Uranotaenia lowii]XP_055608345.1 uncharacterized protein LOC129755741 isoform X3 [Uranotaenia lowii]
MFSASNQDRSKSIVSENAPNKPRNNKTNGNNGGSGNPNPSSSKKNARLCPGRDVYERMNYLYQASVLMSELPVPALSGVYGKLMKSIGKKAVLRIEPAIKRTLCTRCGVALNPGSTATYSDHRKKNYCYIQAECKHCGYSKRFVNRKNHQIHLENPKSLLESLHFE